MQFEKDFDTQNRLSESSNESDTSSIDRENRIRRAAEFEDYDAGNEGNKSTYLRPSKTNKSTQDLNKSAFEKSAL